MTEITATARGVLTDVVGVGLDRLDRDQVDEVLMVDRVLDSPWPT